MTRWVPLLALVLLAAGGGLDARAVGADLVAVETVELGGSELPAEPDGSEAAEQAASAASGPRSAAASSEASRPTTESLRSHGSSPPVPPPR